MPDLDTRIAAANDRMVLAYALGDLPAARAAMDTLYRLIRERNATVDHEKEAAEILRLR